ncbi:MAG: hypothetical protein OJF51_002062 [Nitrospira sp.]|jgi:uncharacterized protein with HEPN domain|nr:MAG: hypothetical protein OJF51_002062 [Nitrospira sp.]
MRKEDDVRLRHMLDAAREALGFVQGRNRVDLNSDRQLVLALVKAIEIIGEAAFRTSENSRAQFPEIRWEDIVGMRHRLVHAYFDINLDVLWKTVQDDLAPLIARLEQVLDTERH